MSWALKKNVGEKKKGTGTPGWKDWLRPRPREGQGGAKGRVGSPDLLPQQPCLGTGGSLLLKECGGEEGVGCAMGTIHLLTSQILTWAFSDSGWTLVSEKLSKW